MNIRSISTETHHASFNLGKTLYRSDPRTKWPEFHNAKPKEINGYIDKGVWTVVLKKDVPTNSSNLRSHFVLTIKDIAADNRS